MNTAKSLELIARERSILARMWERLPTYLSDFREDPRWLIMFTLGRTTLGRRLYAPDRHRVYPPHDQGASMFLPKAAEILAALRMDGIFSDLRLPDDITSQILAFAQETSCFGNHDRDLDLTPEEHLGRQSAHNPVTSGHYFERIEECRAAMAVQADSLLNAVAREYLGHKAKIISTRLWWSFPASMTDAESKPTTPREMLHFDLDDWRMLKYFFYITPVDADAGPHLYLRGTHRHHALKHQFSITVGRPMEEVLATYGADRLSPIHGDAGSGFAEDPYGYHAGSLARAAPRLMLEIGFGITPANRRRFFGERVFGKKKLS